DGPRFLRRIVRPRREFVERLVRHEARLGDGARDGGLAENVVTALDERELRPGDGALEGVVDVPCQRLVERVVRGVMLVKGGVPGARLARVMVHREEEVSASVLEEIDARVQLIPGTRPLATEAVIGAA